MVYNGTSSGLKNALWDPHFDLPTVKTTMRETEEGNSMVDRDIGIFLNFVMIMDVRPYCRVGIHNVRTEEEWEGGII